MKTRVYFLVLIPGLSNLPFSLDVTSALYVFVVVVIPVLECLVVLVFDDDDLHRPREVLTTVLIGNNHSLMVVSSQALF